jgi:hypothetical protein
VKRAAKSSSNPSKSAHRVQETCTPDGGFVSSGETASGGRSSCTAAGEPEKAARLQEEIKALEPLAKGGRSAADTNTRARDNVRKAIGVVLAHLREGGPEEKAFAQHLQEHLSLGYECLYSLPEGRIWE